MVNTFGNDFKTHTVGAERDMEAKYLNLLSEKFNSEEKVVTEIINLESILDLPKGTEHFVSDLHGEFQAFQHVLRNDKHRDRVSIFRAFQK